MAVVCEKCGKNVSDNVITCYFCGTLLKKLIKCKTCGREVISGAPKCQFCGEVFEMPQQATLASNTATQGRKQFEDLSKTGSEQLPVPRVSEPVAKEAPPARSTAVSAASKIELAPKQKPKAQSNKKMLKRLLGLGILGLTYAVMTPELRKMLLSDLLSIFVTTFLYGLVIHMVLNVLIRD